MGAWAEKLCEEFDARRAAAYAADVARFASMVARAAAHLYPDSPDGARPPAPARPRRKILANRVRIG